jgi:hypothetical protein
MNMNTMLSSRNTKVLVEGVSREFIMKSSMRASRYFTQIAS